MEEFAKMVEVFKWRRDGPKQKETFASLAATLNHCDDEEGSAGTGCTGSLPKKDEAYSSPSPSLLQNMGHDVSMDTIKTDAVSLEIPDRAPSFASSRHRPRKRHLLKKQQSSLPSRSTRQLVFSVEDMDAKGRKERNVKPKKMRKNRSKGKKVELKQDGSEFIPQVQACNFPDFYDESECENGRNQEFHSPGICYSPGQGATCIEENGNIQRTSNPGTRHAFISGISPYFMSSKLNAKKNGANTDNGKLMKKSEVKPRNKRQRTDGSVAKMKAEVTEIKHLAEGNETLDSEHSGKQRAHLSKPIVSYFDSSVLPSKSYPGTKKSAYFEAKVKALGQRDIVNKSWVPPISVHALIQEELYKDPWRVLVACMLLNKTSGKQMQKIIWDLFDLCPTPEAAVTIETIKIEDVIRGLGLQRKRARMIQKFSEDYLGKDWTNVKQLHGIGKYATDAYAIFCEGRWREVKPEDHKLVDYWKCLCDTDGLGYAFKDDRGKSREVSPQSASVEI